MTILTSLGRALAADSGRAEPITTVRHLHVSAHPLVLVPLAMAGETNAPMAALIGTDRKNPRLLVVSQPRNRDQRFAFAHELARALLAQILPIASYRVPSPKKSDGQPQCVDAPQIWVPNRAGVHFVRMLGRSTRFRKPTGPWRVPANVPRMGKWLTFYADRNQYAGSSLLMSATAALSAHWATGQSPEEDEHLGTLLAWIQPGDNLTGTQAAEIAEDPIEHPPAGPITDPTFDNTVLAPLIRRHHENTGNTAEGARIQARIEAALHSQMIQTWQHVWQTIDLLHDLPAGEHVATRWAGDIEQFTRAADWIETSPATQPKRDSAVEAARRLYDLECAQDLFDAQRAFDDPLVMAEARMVGEAFAGTVTAAEPNRRIDNRKLPLIEVQTTDPVRLPEGTEKLCHSLRPSQKATIVSITDDTGGLRIVLELSGRDGPRRLPEPGTVPEVGDPVCYSPLSTDFRRNPPLPPRSETPWTHGGPPQDYIPTDDDAREDWE